MAIAGGLAAGNPAVKNANLPETGITFELISFILGGQECVIP